MRAITARPRNCANPRFWPAQRAILANTGFAAISAEIQREWLALGVSPGRLVRTASGVDAEQFRPGRSSVDDRLLPRPRIMFTGRLHPQKNLPLLLEAWSAIAPNRPGSLILVGPGDDRQAYSSWPHRWVSPTGSSSRAAWITPPTTSVPPTSSCSPAWRKA